MHDMQRHKISLDGLYQGRNPTAFRLNVVSVSLFRRGLDPRKGPQGWAISQSQRLWSLPEAGFESCGQGSTWYSSFGRLIKKSLYYRYQGLALRWLWFVHREGIYVVLVFFFFTGFKFVACSRWLQNSTVQGHNITQYALILWFQLKAEPRKENKLVYRKSKLQGIIKSCITNTRSYNFDS